MTRIDIPEGLYPELLIAALRDEIRRDERRREARDAAHQRRRQVWAALRARLGRPFAG